MLDSLELKGVHVPIADSFDSSKRNTDSVTWIYHLNVWFTDTDCIHTVSLTT